MLYCSFCNYTVKNKNLLGEVIAHLTWILIQIVFFFCADSMGLDWKWIECSQYLKPEGDAIGATEARALHAGGAPNLRQAGC